MHRFQDAEASSACQKGKIMTNKIGLIIKRPKETVTQKEIDRNRAEYTAQLLK